MCVYIDELCGMLCVAFCVDLLIVLNHIIVFLFGGVVDDPLRIVVVICASGVRLSARYKTIVICVVICVVIG